MQCAILTRVHGALRTHGCGWENICAPELFAPHYPTAGDGTGEYPCPRSATPPKILSMVLGSISAAALCAPPLIAHTHDQCIFLTSRAV